ncbi:MAG: dethiobiotin synthase [Candidatus Omnitrophota bacterium]
MKGIFITGTDTGVGKTLVTGLLARYLLDKGYDCITQKWVETGTSGFSKDVNRHLKLMGRKRQDVKDLLKYISPYSFRFPSSPHLAADLEERRICERKIKESFRFLSKKFDRVLVEGAGGVLVPYRRDKFIIDIAKDLNLPVLIVAGNRLGAINHTLMTVESLRKRGMRIKGIVFNSIDIGANRNIINDNIDTIKRLSGVDNTALLPFLPGGRPNKRTIDIFDNIFREIKEKR